MSPPGESESPRPAVPPQRQSRIGDAERDQAARCLQEHMAQGRLDGEEFGQRVTRALTARTAADLQPLFDDLPEPRPTGLLPQASAPPTPPAPQQRSRGGAVAMAGVWPATILVYVLTGFDHWWLFVVAAMLTWFLKSAFGSRPAPEGRDDGPRSLHR